MPSKKAKSDEEPLKPLSFYVKDRLELTKQLFSCLKSKQIKSRLPANLQNKSIERIQQICLDEILGISSKRLLSIINNTACPADTESDSDIEHISLSEISSEDDDDEIAVVGSDKNKDKASENRAGSSKSKSREPTEKSPNEPKTMLELIELEARARAIRSQLALEPVTKIELDDSEDEEVPEESPVTGPVQAINNAQPSTSKSSNSAAKSSEPPKKSSEKSKESNSTRSSSDTAKKSKPSESTEKFNDSSKKSSDSSKKISEPQRKDTSKDIRTRLSSPSSDKSKSSSRRNEKKSPTPPSEPPISRRVVLVKKSHHAELTITAPAPKPSAPPVKLKRNFSKTPSETSLSVTSKESDTNIAAIKEETVRSRSQSPDVITMEQNISTYFISDSDDEQPPTKRKSPEKSPQKGQDKDEKSSQDDKNESIANDEKEEAQKIDGDLKSSETIAESLEPQSNAEDKVQSSELELESMQVEPAENPLSSEKSPEKPASPSIADGDDDNVVNLMSDTEIDFNASDKEEEEESDNALKEPTTKESTLSLSTSNEKESKEVSQPSDSDNDVVEILHSDDDLDTESSSKAPEESETWNQRYLRSSTVKSVLKTTKLASKVRGKIAANKKTQKEKIQKKKIEEKEKQKEMSEKMSKLEEGSMEQFQILKESSNSSV